VVPILAFSQGDPAGVGPEILCKLLQSAYPQRRWRPLLVAERAAFAALPLSIRGDFDDRLVNVDPDCVRQELEDLDPEALAILDPVSEKRVLQLGTSGPRDAAGAVAAIDTAVAVVQRGVVDALVTLPISKESIATQYRAGFRGHTEYLAAKAGLERYGRDYLMAFLAPGLQVALLTTHIPLRQAIDELSPEQIIEALQLLDRRVGGRVAVAGLNPHAGEAGLMGDEEDRIIRPAIGAVREQGIEAIGPESADSLFARARRGEFDWVLALYHDQGLIAVKTASFGAATNWTMGLPFLRTSVDHGTAFGIAGHGVADEGPLAQVIETTLKLISGRLPATST
jgi:4-hydroxythreonine-4-phosphate dehydrogenase